MKVIKPSFEILDDLNGVEIMKKIEKAGRTCYKSEDRITDASAPKFVNMICNTHKHHSVIEHESVSVRFICDRGVTHEMVRHRLASYSQESTRYVNYSQDKHGAEIQCIYPNFWAPSSEDDQVELDKKEFLFAIWKHAMENAEKAYFQLLENGASPQEARSVLPNSLKTEIVVTMNLRSWLHYFDMRTAKNAHPQIVEVSKPLLEVFASELPIIFGGLYNERK